MSRDPLRTRLRRPGLDRANSLPTPPGMSSRAGIWRATLSSVVWLAAALILSGGGSAQASPTEVVRVKFVKFDGRRWEVSVTLRHADTGWKHYANVWVVETLEGKTLGRRVLFHPHEDEQPFTRSLSLTLPKGVTKVRIRAGDNVGGMDSNMVVVILTRSSGERYDVR